MGYIWQPSDNGFVNSNGEIGIWVKETEKKSPTMEYNSSGSNSSSYNPYAEILKMQFEEQNRLMNQQLNLKRQQADTQYNSRVKNINIGADELQRQAYIAKKQGERILPQQLKAVGISGGDSETTLQNMDASYKSNRYNTDIERQKSILEAAADKDSLNMKAYNDFLESNIDSIKSLSQQGAAVQALQGSGNKSGAYINDNGQNFATYNAWAAYKRKQGYSEEEINKIAQTNGLS